MHEANTVILLVPGSVWKLLVYRERTEVIGKVDVTQDVKSIMNVQDGIDLWSAEITFWHTKYVIGFN